MILAVFENNFLVIITTSAEIINCRLAAKTPLLTARSNCNYCLSTSFKVILAEGIFLKSLLFQYFDNYQKIIGCRMLNSLNGQVS